MDAQQREDIAECVSAYYCGGKRLASMVFRAIAEARGLKRWEVMALGDKVRAELARHGYLQIVG